MPIVSVLFFDLVNLSATKMPTTAKHTPAVLLRITGFILYGFAFEKLVRGFDDERTFKGKSMAF